LDEKGILNYSNSKINGLSCSYDIKRKKNNAFISKYNINTLSVLNLKEDACRLLDKDLISRENKTNLSIKVHSKEIKLKKRLISEKLKKNSNKKPRGEDLLKKIGKKSKSPEDKFKSQETKKYWGSRNFKRPNECSNFSSGKTVDGFSEKVELSKLKEKTKLKNVKDIIEQDDDESISSNDIIDRQEYERNYETENLDLLKDIDELHGFENGEDSFENNDEKEKLNYKSNRTKLAKLGKKKKIKNLDLICLTGKIDPFSNKKSLKLGSTKKIKNNSSIFNKKAWTERKVKKLSLSKNIKFKKKIKNKSYLFSGKINYSRISLNPNEVKIYIIFFIFY
jgi:hypothetical protein